MKKEFKVGDRVAMYHHAKRYVGTIESGSENANFFYVKCAGFLPIGAHPKQLRPIPTKKKKITHEAWVNLFPGGRIDSYKTKIGADAYSTDRIECRRITWESEE